MRKEKVKYYISGLLLFFVLIIISLSAAADTVAYSLTLNCFVYKDDFDKPIIGDEFALIKVADCFINESGDIITPEYKTVQRFEEFDRMWIDVTSSEMRILSKEIANDVTPEDYAFVNNTDNNGIVRFPLKDPGLYLIIRSNTDDNSITFEPFLISVPQIINEDIICDVVSYPKFEYITSDTDDPEIIHSDTDASDGRENIDSLPQTGQMNLPVVILLCLGIPMIFIGSFLIMGEKNEEK